MYKKLFPSHPLISSPVGKRNRKADLGGTLELSVKPHTWIPGDLQATSTWGRTRYYFTLYFKRLFSQIHSYYHLLFVQGCVQELSETKQIKIEMQKGTAGSCSKENLPFVQQALLTNQTGERTRQRVNGRQMREELQLWSIMEDFSLIFQALPVQVNLNYRISKQNWPYSTVLFNQ